MNQAIGLLTLGWLDASGNTTFHLIMLTVFQPAMLGAVAGLLAIQEWLPQRLRRIVMPAVRPVNKSFDFAFDQLPGPAFLILSFEDGTAVHGFFGTASMAEGFDQRSGIYVERLYVVGDDDEWMPKTSMRGAWISLSGLRSIEFIASEDLLDGEDTL